MTLGDFLHYYIAHAFTKLQFYVAACSLDDTCYDAVIVDEACTPHRAYTVHSNIPIPTDLNLKMLNLPPDVLVQLVERYARSFPNTFDGRLHQFLNGFFAFNGRKDEPTTLHGIDAILFQIDQQHFR